jgi:cell division control protein 42
MTYITNKFPNSHSKTTVLDKYLVNVAYANELYTFVLYDTLDQEDFDRKLPPFSFPQWDVFLVCFSVANVASFETVKKKWLPLIAHRSAKTPFLLVGTQLDLREEAEEESFVSYEKGKKLAKELNAFKYCECSSLDQVIPQENSTRNFRFDNFFFFK